MSSRKQRNANKRNAQNSTGPQTDAGKQHSAQNALKHGVYSLRAVIPGEDPAEFDQLCSEFVDEFQPDTPYERSLVRQIADAEWRLRRISRLEADFLEGAFESERRSLGDPQQGNEPNEGLLFGRALQTRTAELLRFSRYEADLTRRQRQAHKSLVEYRKQKNQTATAGDRSQWQTRNPRDHSQPREPFYHPTGDIRSQLPDFTEQTQFRPTATKSTTSDPPGRTNSDESAA